MFKDSAMFSCLLWVGAFILTLIGAVLLRVSCALYNLLAGASDKPSCHPARRTAGDEPETATTKEADSAPSASAARAEDESRATVPGVPKPSFEWALSIFVVTTLLNVIASFVALRLLRHAGQAGGSDALGSLSILLVCYPLGILILGGMSAAMLPTSLGKGLLVALLFLLLSVFIAAILAALVASIVLAFGLSIARFG